MDALTLWTNWLLCEHLPRTEDGKSANVQPPRLEGKIQLAYSILQYFPKLPRAEVRSKNSSVP
jgi:hypothetical protein